MHAKANRIAGKTEERPPRALATAPPRKKLIGQCSCVPGFGANRGVCMPVATMRASYVSGSIDPVKVIVFVCNTDNRVRLMGKTSKVHQDREQWYCTSQSAITRRAWW